MRRTRTEPIGGIVAQVLSELNIDGPLKQAHVLHAWPVVLGSAIGQVTDKLYFRRPGVLCARIRSSVVRNELLMNRQQIVERLNQEVGDQVVNEIIIL